jgi:hypothetical protein
LSPPEIYFGTNAQKQGAVCQLKNSVLLKTNTTKTNTNNHAKSKMPYLWAFTPKALSLRHMLATPAPHIKRKRAVLSFGNHLF